MNIYHLRLGDTVVFDPSTMSKEWERLSDYDKRRYYSDVYDFDKNKPVMFTFLADHHPQVGHCVLVSMEDQSIQTMRHTSNFRKLTDDEC